MDTVSVKIVEYSDELEKILQLRQTVFIKEQKVPEDEEIDDLDSLEAISSNRVIHLIAYAGEEVFGTARLFLPSTTDIRTVTAETLHVGRVAVKQTGRRLGLGSLLMNKCHEIAREIGHKQITLSAQIQAMPFYRELGYKERGPLYLDAGIQHQDMDITLDPD
ncbi:MAG TPA: hypothetical protein DCR03_00220 [Gammaproteobacteria bacterium]|jgi:predicted GNAT family N-acyltransferase|nr:hypothetical protein [Gammaproteobacteria bacterium]|tara:strand:- start:412 stop:900 length:489 start_codon:yes stop_codon:yes gene_type:complete